VTPEDGVEVLETGIAVVHEGEHIRPAAGAHGRFGEPASAAESGSGPDVHYHFPVHLVVTGSVPESDRAQIQDEILQQLYRALG
jgi:hypothetical protein